MSTEMRSQHNRLEYNPVTRDGESINETRQPEVATGLTNLACHRILRSEIEIHRQLLSASHGNVLIEFLQLLLLDLFLPDLQTILPGGHIRDAVGSCFSVRDRRIRRFRHQYESLHLRMNITEENIETCIVEGVERSPFVKMSDGVVEDPISFVVVDAINIVQERVTILEIDRRTLRYRGYVGRIHLVDLIDHDSVRDGRYLAVSFKIHDELSSLLFVLYLSAYIGRILC